MERLPLLVGAKPLNGLKGPFVFLREGDWKVDLSQVIDSVITYNDRQSLSPPHLIRGPIKIRLEIEKSGSEKSLTIFAIRTGD